jgi:LPS export ABC transporter protein LptC
MKNHLVYLLFIVFIISCSKKAVEKSSQPAQAEQTIEEFSVVDAKGGKPHWSLTASSAQILETEKVVLLNLPKIKFFEKGKYVSTLTSAKGKINMDNYDFFAEGQCVLTTAKGERLDTSNMRYDSVFKRIVTNEKVKLVRPGQVIYGDGLEATPDLEVIKIKNQELIVNDENQQKK